MTTTTTLSPSRLRRLDPSRTLTLRRAYAADYKRRWRAVMTAARESITADAFRPGGRFYAATSQGRADALSAWLDVLITSYVVGNGVWQRPYIRSAYIRGLANAHADLRRDGWDIADRPEELAGRLTHAPAINVFYGQAAADLDRVRRDVVATVGTMLQGPAVNQERPDGDETDEEWLWAMEQLLLITGGRSAVARSRAIAGGVVVGAAAEAVLSRLWELGLRLVSPVIEMEFVTTGDDRVCATCQGLEAAGPYTIEAARGLIPVHVGCVAPDTLITAADGIAAASKRIYQGDLVRLITSSGKELAVTPNHPILTPAGWLDAKTVQVGDNVFSDDLRRITLVDNNAEYRPAPIEEVADALFAFSPFGAVQVPISAEDFHNDGQRGKGEIAVININRLLWGEPVVRPFQNWNQFPFHPTHLDGESFLKCRGPSFPFVDGNSTASSGFVGRRYLCRPTLISHLRPFKEFGLVPAAHGDASLLQSPYDSGPANAIMVGEGIGTEPALIQRNDFIRWQVEPIISTEVVSYYGHVYNLETKNGYYAANSIITHNCRCTWRPVAVAR